MNWYQRLKATCPEAAKGLFWKHESLWKKNRPLCGAKCRDGHECKAKAVVHPKTSKPINGRCRIHGGLSTGPKTEDGRQRTREAASQGMKEYWRKRKLAQNIPT